MIPDHLLPYWCWGATLPRKPSEVQTTRHPMVSSLEAHKWHGPFHFSPRIVIPATARLL